MINIIEVLINNNNNNNPQVAHMCKGEMAQLDSSLLAPIILLLNHFLGIMVTFCL